MSQKNMYIYNTVDGSEIRHQLRLVVSPIIYKVSYMPGGWPSDFFHQPVSFVRHVTSSRLSPGRSSTLPC